jgi:hypothetical protein
VCDNVNHDVNANIVNTVGQATVGCGCDRCPSCGRCRRCGCAPCAPVLPPPPYYPDVPMAGYGISTTPPVYDNLVSINC